MAGLWKNQEHTREGKYLVLRRDGTIPQWPYFVIAASDPAAPFALKGYAAAAAVLGMSTEYVTDIKALAVEFDTWCKTHGMGDPDAPRHRVDDPAIIAMMSQAKGS